MEFNIGRYRNIEEQNFECEVVTPMFVAGADTNHAALREPTIKGLLRFWWRATNEFPTLSELKKKEGDIFGSTEQKSKVTICLNMINIKTGNSLPHGSTVRKPEKFQGDILKYLSYGTQKRPYIRPGARFDLMIRYPKEYEADILSAMYGLYMFGGIGSKSRNGFGSFRLLNTKIERPKQIMENNLDVADYTKVSNRKHQISTENVFDDWEEALSRIGYVYWSARMTVDKRHVFDGRAQIAKPIVAQRERVPKQYQSERQAKPFFLHISRIKRGENKDKYRGWIRFFPVTSMLEKDGTYTEVFKKAIEAIKSSGEMK